ncbi:MAG: DUF4298 domain-containing protein [Clostridia bacterium]|nr:DUF4298 domain-containing protein [Clostridia bacterium]
MNDEKKERAEQIARIERNEALYDRIGRTVRRLERSIEAYEKMEPKIKELAAYYESELWKKDFSDDEAGLIPNDLKRGVLSEDGVYDLLERIAELDKTVK